MSIHDSFENQTVAKSSLWCRLAPLTAAIALCLAGGVQAADIVVNDAAEGSVVGMCTLADAVGALNTQLPVNGCIAGDGSDDTIDLTGFVAPTSIIFSANPNSTNRVLQLTANATIVGSLDANNLPYVTIERSSVSGTPDFGLIGTTAALTIDGVILRNGSVSSGYSGGAILTGSPLTIRNSIITGNHSSSAGGGIAATNSVTLFHSSVLGNTATYAGGGIQTNGSVTAYYSTVSNNLTTDSAGVGGGGIYASGGVLAMHATVTGNTSAINGGGILSSGTVSLSDSTVSGNSATVGIGGAIAVTGADLNLTRCTVHGNHAGTNGGGVYSSGNVNLLDSTITGNIAGGSGAGVYATTAALTYATIFANSAQNGFGGGMFFTTSANAAGTIVFANSPQDLNSINAAPLSGSFNLIGNSAIAVPADTLTCDPMLGALSDNGGATLTLPLLSGSCAIDAAAEIPAVNRDQRGYVRPAPVGATPKADIGAFEFGATDPDIIFRNGFEP